MKPLLVLVLLAAGGCASYTPNTIVTMPPACAGVTIVLGEDATGVLMVPGMVCPRREPL